MSAVPAGYKRTEVGVIPSDWGVLSIANLVNEFRGGAPLKPSDFLSTGVKVVPKGGIGRKGWLQVEEKDIQFCSIEYANSHKSNTVNSSYSLVVLRDLVPSGPSIGLIVQIQDDETFVLAQGVYGFKVNNAAESRYLVQLSNTSWYRRQVNSIMVGSTQVHITNTAFKALNIPVPPIAEQQTIATALSDADAYIESLEQLLDKKRNIKQGAMQELLTGKRRLAGFSGEWVVKSFDDVLSRINAKSHQIESAEYQVVGIHPVVDQGKTLVVGFSDQTEKLFVCPQNGVIIFGDHTCIVKFINFDFLIGADGTQLLIAKNGQSIRFHFYQLAYSGVIPTGYNRHFKTLKEKCFKCTSIEEQTAIATILSDMDAELEALQAKLDKACSLKQGMMQQLLTGKIRLV